MEFPSLTELKKAINDSDQNLGNSINAMQMGMIMGVSQSMNLCVKTFLSPAALARFVNDKEDDTLRFLVSVVYHNNFFNAFYYEGVDNA